MREIFAEVRLHRRARARARAVAGRAAAPMQVVAVYGSLALIAAIVLGAVSVRPF